MATELGRYFVSISADTSGVGASLTRSLSKASKSSQSVGAKIGANLGKGITSGTTPAINGVTKKLAGMAKSTASSMSGVMGKATSSMSGMMSKATSSIASLSKSVISKTGSAVRSASASAMSGISSLVSSTGSAMASVGKKALSSITSLAKSAISTITSAAKAASAVAATAIGATLTSGFKRLSNIEQAQTILKSLGINVSQAMEQANKAVLGTRFGLDEAAKAIANLSASGVGLQDTPRYLKAITDAATISGSSMGDIAQIVSQVAAAGKAELGDMWQLTDRGINIFGALEKQTGKTRAEVMKMFSEGKISADLFISALGETYDGAAALGGSTVTGSFSNFKAAVGRLGASILESTFKQLPKLIQRATKLVDKLSPAIVRVSSTFTSGLIPAANKGLDAIENFGEAGIDAFGTKLNEGVSFATKAFQTFVQVVKNVASVVIPVVKALVSVIADIAKAVAKLLPSIISLAKIVAREAFIVFKQVLADTVRVVSNMARVLRDVAATFLPVVRILALAVWDAFVTVVSEIVDAVARLNATTSRSTVRSWAYAVADGIKTLVTNVVSLVKAITPLLGILLAPVWGLFVTTIKAVIDGIGSFASSLNSSGAIGWATQVSVMLNRLVASVKSLSSGFITLIKAIASPVWGLFSGIINVLLTYIGKLSSAVASSGFASWAYSVGASIKTATGYIIPLLDSVGKLLVALASNVWAMFGNIIRQISPTLKDIATTLTSTLGSKSIITTVTNITTGFGNLLSILINNAWVVVKSMLSTITSLLGTLSNALLAISQNTAFISAIQRIAAVFSKMMTPLRVIGEAFINIFSQVIVTVADLLATVLEALQPVIASVARSFSGMANKLIPEILSDVSGWIKRLAPQFGELLTKLVPVVARVADSAWGTFAGFLELFVRLLEPIIRALDAVLDFLNKNKWAADALGGALVGAFIASKITKVILGLSGALDTAKKAQAAFNAVANMNPYAALAIAIGLVIGGLIYFFTQTESGRKAWKKFTDFLKRAGKWAGEELSKAWDDVGRAFRAMGDGISWVYQHIIKPPLKWMKDRIDDIKNAFKAMKKAAKAAFDWLGDKGGKIGDWLGFADGGVVPGPVTSRTARADNVLAKLSPGEIVWSNADIARAGGTEAVESARNGNGTIGSSININSLQTMDVSELIRQLEKMQRRQARMAV